MWLLDKLKCKTCDFRARRTSRAICWKLFDQCGNCAFRDHPEAFGRTVHKNRIAKRSFGVCSNCGNRNSSLRASVNAGMREIEGRYCFDCKIMRINDKEIVIEQ
jgi:hypothetical protein